MGSLKAVRVAVATCAALLVVASAVIAAVGPGQRAVAGTPATTMRYGCDRKSDGLLRYAKGAGLCTTHEQAVDLQRQSIGVCALVERTGGHPKSILGLVHKGAIRVVSKASQCVKKRYGRELPLVLPDYKTRYFCAVGKPGQLRIRKRQDPCNHGNPVKIPARSATPTPTPSVTPTVTPALPTAANDAATTDEATATNVNVLSNDSSGAPPVAVNSVNADGARGQVSLNSDGTLRYDPHGQFEALNAGATAKDTFSYQIEDAAGRTAGPATVTVTVGGIDDAPTLAGLESAALTFFTGDPATPVTSAITVADVDNDTLKGATVAITSGFSAGHDELQFTDADGITGSWDASAGKLTLTGTASKAAYQSALRGVRFRSPGGTTGSRTVGFRVDDGSLQSDVASRTVTVDKAPVASNDGKTLDEDAGATAIDVLANDDNADGGPETIASVTQPAHGSAAVTGGGSGVTYTPGADYCGADSFTYTLNGGSVGTVSLTVNCLNDAPVNTVPGAQTIDEDTPLTLHPSVADVDAGSDNIQVTITADHGVISGGGTFAGTVTVVNQALDGITYTPTADYNGGDTITMTTSDLGHNGAGGTKTDTDTIAVTINAVNDAPVNTVPGAQTTAEDTPFGFAASVADVDAGSDPISVTITALHGAISGGPTFTGTVAQVNSAFASLTYTPDADYHGADTITVVSNDQGHNGSGGAKTDTDTIGVTVTSVNDAPVAAADNATTNEDTALSGGSVLINDTDADGDTLTAVLVSGPSHAAGFTLHDDGTYSYTPSADYNGSDSFTYQASDGTATSATTTVSLNVVPVNDPPVLTVPGTQTINEDNTQTFSGANAPSVADVDAGGAALSLTVGVNHGTLALDGGGTTKTGTLAQLNDALDGLTYTPDANFNGAATVTLTVNDQGNTGSGGAKSDTKTITVNVTAVNDGPVNSVPAAVTTAEDTPFTFSGANKLSFADADADPDAVSITLSATHGAVALSQTTGLTVAGNGTETVTASGTVANLNAALDGLVYTPAADYNGDAAVTLVTNDNGHNGVGGALTDSDSVAVTVTSVNDFPVITAPGTQTTAEDTALVVNPSPTITDVDAGGSTIESTLSVAHGTLTLSTVVGLSFQDGTANNTGTIKVRGTQSAINQALQGLTYTPDANYNGTDTLALAADDLAGGTASRNVAITVNAADDAPVLDLDSTTAGSDSNASFSELATHNNSVTVAPNAAVSDVDDANLEGATIVLTNHPDGAAESITVDTTGTAIVADTSTLFAITLTGSDTKAHYAQVLQSLSFHDTAAPPTTTQRDITVSVTDGDVGSNTATAHVSVARLDVPPDVDLDSTNALSANSTAGFVEDGGPVAIAPHAAVTDVDDDNLESATVTLSARPDGDGAESLAVSSTAGTAGITVDAYVPSSGVLFLHGTGTKADYATLLQRVTYNDSAQSPDTSTRSISVVVSDGDATSTPRTASVSVTPHNDPPVNGVPGAQSTNEDTPLVFSSGNGNQLSISDPDAGSNTMHLTLTVTHGTLHAPTSNAGTSNITVSGNDSSTVLIDGPQDQLTNELNGLRFDPAANYNGAATLHLHIDDQGFTGTGGAMTDDDDVAITVNPVDDAPIAVDDAYTVDTNLKAQPDAAAGVLHNDTDIDSGAVTAVLVAGPTKGTLTFNPNGSFVYAGTKGSKGTDTFTYKANDGTVDSNVATVTIDLSAAPVANPGSGSTNEDSQITLLLSGTDANGDSLTFNPGTPSHGTLGAVSIISCSNSATNCLATVQYTPAADYNGTDSFTYTISDGTKTSAPATETITLNPVNDAPVLSGTETSALSYTENDAPTVISGTTAVSDVDSADFNGGTLTVSLANGAAEDRLAVRNQGSGPGQIGVAGASVTFSGTTIGSIAGGTDGTTPLTVTLNGNATPTATQALVENITYANASDNPSTATRTASFVLTDGDGGTSTPATRDITITAVDDAPVAGNDTFSGIGNTTLNVNDPTDGRLPTPDPTDTSPVTDRPHKEVTGSILANDTDPDSPSGSLTVTPGTYSGTGGSSVTIQSDGDFNFEPGPAASCTDPSESFQYTVSDGTATSTGQVTITLSGCVWYVNNNDAQGNSGTSEKPFDTLAQAQTASRVGDSIFVYDGDDTTTGYDTGITLKNSQTLLSEAVTFAVGGDVLHIADAANKASLTNNNADVVTLAVGDTVRGLNIDPKGTGGGIFGGTPAVATTTINDVSIVDNGTKGTQPGLELDGTTGATTNISNLTIDNGDGSSATTGDKGVRLNDAGTVNFASTGKISITTNGAAALDAAAGTGSTNLGSASTFDDITVTNSGSGGVSLNGTGGSGTAFGDGSGTDLSLSTTSGGTPAFNVVSAGSFDVPSAGTANVDATGGPAVNVTGTSGATMSFDSVSSTNSATQALNLSGLGTGTFSAASGTFAGFTGTAIVIAGGSGGITIPETINNGTGDAANVSGRSGGVIDISGNISDTSDAGGGITESGNSGGSTIYRGATKQFNTGAQTALSVSNPDGSTHTTTFSGGGTDIDTSSGTGVNVTGVGSTADGNIQFSGTGNTIDSSGLGAANRALNIADVNLTSTGVTFDHVASSGGTNGIRLSDTGSSGAFAVTGIGGTCTSADTSGCSGGVVTGASAAGIDLTNVGNGAALTRMNVKNGGDDGIHASTVSKLNLKNSVIAGNGTAGPTGAGENGLDWTNVTGVSGIQNTAVTGSSDFNAYVRNDSGSLDLTVTGDTFSGAGSDDGLQMLSDASATVKSNVDTNTFSDNHGDAFQLTPVDGLSDSSSQDLTFTHNTVIGSLSTTVDGGFVATSGDGEKVKVNVSNNTINNVSVSALILNPGPTGSATSTFDATANANIIGTAGTVDSGSADGDGIQVKSVSDGDSRIAVTNNTIRDFDENGMLLRASESSQSGHSTQLTATGNAISEPDPANSETAIMTEVGSTSTDVTTACMDIGGAGALANTFTGTLSSTNIIGNFWLSLRFANGVLQAPGYTPAGTLAARKAYFLGRNTGFGGGTTPYTEDGNKDMQGHAGGCTQPTAPTLPTPAP